MSSRRSGRGGSDPRARGVNGNRPDPRDPRALRRGYAATQSSAETEKKGVGCAQAMLIVVFMFIVGAGLGYAGFKITAPKVSANNAAPAGTAAPSGTAPATTPSVAPKASPAATPKASGGPVWVASNAPYGI